MATYKFWYAVTYVIKKGGYASYTVYINADSAKHARTLFDDIAYRRDSVKRSHGLNPAHRFQITVKKVTAQQVNLNHVWKAGVTNDQN